MYTIIETAKFTETADKLLTEAERLALLSHLAANPLSGDVIPKSDGCRKLRWKRQGMGKQGGVRVIYYNLLNNGVIIALALYAKSERENISHSELQTLKGKEHGKH